MQADHQDVMHALRELTGFTSRVEIVEMELAKLRGKNGATLLVPQKFVQEAADKRIAALEQKVEKLSSMLERTWDMMEDSDATGRR